MYPRDGSSQAVEQLSHSTRQLEDLPRSLRFDETQPASEFDLRLELAFRSTRDADMVQIDARYAPTLTLGDVGRDRERAAPHLGSQHEAL